MGGVTFAVWAQKEINDAYDIASAADLSADVTLAKILPKLRQAQDAADEAAKYEDELHQEIRQLRYEIQQLKDQIESSNRES
jgi:hypothetical protein